MEQISSVLRWSITSTEVFHDANVEDENDGKIEKENEKEKSSEDDKQDDGRGEHEDDDGDGGDGDDDEDCFFDAVDEGNEEAAGSADADAPSGGGGGVSSYFGLQYLGGMTDMTALQELVSTVHDAKIAQALTDAIASAPGTLAAMAGSSSDAQERRHYDGGVLPTMPRYEGDRDGHAEDKADNREEMEKEHKESEIADEQKRDAVDKEEEEEEENVADADKVNCWSETPISKFKVRGGNYFEDKVKVPSGPYLLRPRGCDIFLAPNASSSAVASDAAAAAAFLDNVDVQSIGAEGGKVPVKVQTAQPPPDGSDPLDLANKTLLLLSGRLRDVPTLLINFRFPWGVLLLYFEVPSNLAPFLTYSPPPSSSSSSSSSSQEGEDPDGDDAAPDMSSLSTSERVLAGWFAGDADYKNDRLKLIPYVVDGPWVVQNLVTGRPVIIGRRLPISYRVFPGDDTLTTPISPLMECSLDIGSSHAMARSIVSVCRMYMTTLTFDIGFVVESKTPDELPEQMFGSVRVHRPDPLTAVELS